MAIKGRHRYVVYLNANCVEKVKDFLKIVDDIENVSGGLSGFLNRYCCELVETIDSIKDRDSMEGLIDHYRSK